MVMTLNLNIYMKRKPKEMRKISFKNADGSLNGKLIAGIISLLIVLIQQIFAMFGIKFTGDWSAIVAVIEYCINDPRDAGCYY